MLAFAPTTANPASNNVYWVKWLAPGESISGSFKYRILSPEDRSEVFISWLSVPEVQVKDEPSHQNLFYNSQSDTNTNLHDDFWANPKTISQQDHTTTHHLRYYDGTVRLAVDVNHSGALMFAVFILLEILLLLYIICRCCRSVRKYSKRLSWKLFNQ